MTQTTLRVFRIVKIRHFIVFLKKSTFSINYNVTFTLYPNISISSASNCTSAINFSTYCGISTSLSPKFNILIWWSRSSFVLIFLSGSCDHFFVTPIQKNQLSNDYGHRKSRVGSLQRFLVDRGVTSKSSIAERLSRWVCGVLQLPDTWCREEIEAGSISSLTVKRKSQSSYCCFWNFSASITVCRSRAAWTLPGL